MILMETAMQIRRRILVDGESIRSVSRTTGISRPTIRKYLDNDNPPSYKTRQAGSRSILRGFEEKLTDWYQTDLTRSKRERQTAKKLFEHLLYSIESLITVRLLKLKMTLTGLSKVKKRLKNRRLGRVSFHCFHCKGW